MAGFLQPDGGARGVEPALTIRVTHCNDGVVLHVQGEVDLATREQFEDRLADACAGGGDVWLDLTDLAFLDPYGARLLGLLRMRHPGLRIASVSEAARRTIEIVDSVDAAGATAGSKCDVDAGRDVAPY
jgi:anti-anti-sigma factor